ncbi:PHP domain-containing protein [candidate division KSB3 bacterium]|uniref:PHP domain-containing protein n=1 Tax=candidate division KSB3 bacterium TaxID=2044937 RepID=A0A9D5Q646_9BACT|nr:PHP domain-containing protein [candidate division KSB3 bacterium]MBD3324897.1 PHP domain-containing protein [candidate division KSB3 bacterium]
MGVRPFAADLHVHSVLSPCGDYNMAPGPILEQARRQHLDLIAITDHNSGENVKAFWEACQGTEITVLPGMEVTTEEEIHVVTLFDDLDTLTTWQALVYEALPPLKNNEEFFGVQVEVDAHNGIVRVHDRLFAGTTSLPINSVIKRVHTLGGLCIPAHVDKPNFSLISQLGGIPPDLDVIALEVFRATPLEWARQHYPDVNRYSVVRASDAHYLQDVGIARTTYVIEQPIVQELRKALLHREGRTFTIDPS